MKKLSNLVFAIIFLSTFSLGGCFNGGNDPPSQAEVNLAVQNFVDNDLVDLVVSLNFFGIDSCNELQALIDDLIGENFCDDGGTFNISIETVNCDDGPPVTASFVITDVVNNCDENGFESDGSLTANLSFDGDTVFMNISSAGITVNDLTFAFSVFQVSIDSTLATTCSGTATVDGETCTASADCESCVL